MQTPPIKPGQSTEGPSGDMYGCVYSLLENRGDGCFVFISLGEEFGLLEPCPSGLMWTRIMTNSQWLLPWEGNHLRNADLHLVDLLLSSYFQFDTKFSFHCLLFFLSFSSFLLFLLFFSSFTGLHLFIEHKMVDGLMDKIRIDNNGKEKWTENQGAWALL